ncbi:MAG: type I methionyl aminopeptidase [Deltaproteobacteria bacterium]|nr:type I methionyl aminopeptidase [Deltaproteobacteria bacterium]
MTVTATSLTAASNVRPLIPPANNAPCWCGSGEKYKKCHRAQDESEAQAAQVAKLAKTSKVTPVKAGIVSPRREVPAHIPRPDYAASGYPGNGYPREKDPVKRLEKMRRACKAAAEVLELTGRAIRPGVTTDELDQICHDACIARGGYPSPLNYRGFPKSLCTSVNEVICHGIPDSRALLDGDLVNLDVTIFLDGVHGDCNATFGVGELDEDSKRLIQVTRECRDAGIAAVRPGRPISDIGRAIEQHCKKAGFTVFRAYCGHGINEIFHTTPEVPHYFDRRANTVMREGMTFTIEPMINAGGEDHIDWDDDWTVATKDGRRSAQFEHTVLVTANGVEVLTLP